MLLHKINNADYQLEHYTIVNSLWKKSSTSSVQALLLSLSGKAWTDFLHKMMRAVDATNTIQYTIVLYYYIHNCPLINFIYFYVIFIVCLFFYHLSIFIVLLFLLWFYLYGDLECHERRP